MGIKRKKMRVGDLVTYVGPSPASLEMGIGIIVEINGFVSVYWQNAWGCETPGIANHRSEYLRKLVIREWE